MHVSLKPAGQLIVAISLSASLALLAGCEDEAAKQREELQRTVEQANDTLRQATLVIVNPDNAEAFQQIRSELNKVVSTLRSASPGGGSGGETGQETAVNLLLADASQKLAALDLAEVEAAAAELRETAGLARTQIGALLRLNEFVAAAESIDITEQSAALDSARTGASEQLAAASEMLAQLDEPISRLSAENSQDAARIEQLRSEAEQLLRRATEQGPADGFAQYEQAVAKNLQAGVIETEIARREINLAYQYEPEHQSADSRAQHLQQFIDSLEQTKQHLSTIAQSIESESSKTSTRIADYRTSIDQRLSDVQAAIAGPMEAGYRSGLDAADKALTAAKAAGRQRTPGVDNGTGKLLEAQILDTQGRLHWSRARALAEQISLLDSVIAAGDSIGSAGEYQRQRSAAQAAHDEAIGLARDAYTAAQAALPGGNSNELNALNRSLTMAIGALSGQDVDEMDLASAASDMAMGSDTGGGSTGYETPEALLAALQGIDSSRPQSALVLERIWHATTPLQQQLMSAMLDMIRSGIELGEVAEEKFGPSFAEGFSQGMSANMPDYDGATISQESDDRATMTIPSAAGPTQTVPLVRLTDAGWKIDFGGMIQNSPESQMMTTEQQLQYSQKLADLFSDFASRVRNDEFASPEQFNETFLQSMSELAGSLST